ncbi:MAG TPA: hypothetical protein VJJ20_03600 [Candidatus Paceibacterota bacterium]
MQPYKTLFIVLAVLAFHALPISSTAHETEGENTAVIHIDENGFSPDVITVAPGTEVIFENTGTEDHWPASDNHPTHTRYDGTTLQEHCANGHSNTFDSCGPISPGDSWSFVFKKGGSFAFHDHLWAHFDGTITVQEEGATLAKEKSLVSLFFDSFRKAFTAILSFFIRQEGDLDLQSGNTNNEFYESVKTGYKNLVDKTDPRQAIQALEQESQEDARVAALCHDILHEIGRTAYKKYGGFNEAAAFQSDFCNSGYIHGIFESYFKSASSSLSMLAKQCSEYASTQGRQFDLWQCHHGVGHGFMYLTGGDLDESLALCDRYMEEAGTGCQNGAYMEVFNLEVLAKESGYIDPENPFATCKARSQAKGDCYVYVPTYLSQTRGMDFPDILKECNKAEFGYKGSCLGGVAAEAIKRNMGNPGLVFALCGQAGSFINQELCTAGLVDMYMNQKGSYFAGVELCKQAPQDLLDSCNSVVNNRAPFFK